MNLNSDEKTETCSITLKPEMVKQEIRNEHPPSFVQNLQHYFWEYCSRSTIHGLSYLGERRRTLSERIWWLISILISLYLCIALITNIYEKWATSPVIVTLAKSQTPIWEIPFPAITICPETKSAKERCNYTDLYAKKRNKQNVTDTEALEFEYMSLVCEPNIALLNEGIQIIAEDAIDFFVEVSVNFNSTFSTLDWKEQFDEDLPEFFFPVLTDDGLCYTFNGLDRSELFTENVINYRNLFSTNEKAANWSVESGYLDDTEIESYPKRTSTPGIDGGLTVYFTIHSADIDYMCGEVMQGFKVIIHSPAEVPYVKNQYFRIPLDSWVFTAVKPNIMKTSNALRNYHPQDRQCYFVEERKLKYFKIYNQKNCLSECLIEFTLETCGCVGFYMQRTNSTPICNAFKQRMCVAKAKGNYLTSEVNKVEKNVSKFTKKCDCLPSCNSLDFDVEISQSEWHFKQTFETLSQIEKNDDYIAQIPMSLHFQRLSVFFKDIQFVTSERNELYGKTDFWANCGGLLGLFTGFSFISALEILYYLTLRFICNLHRFGRHYWSGSEEILEHRKII